MDWARRNTLFPNLIVGLALLVPPIVFAKSNLTLRPEFIAGSIFMLYLLVRRKNVRELFRLDTVGVWLMVFAGAMALSSLYSWLALGVRFVPRDITEFVRLAYYLFLYSFSFRIYSRERVNFTLQFAWAASGLVIGFSFLQYWDVAGINRWLTPYYTDSAQLSVLNQFHRIFGTTGNSNVFGFFLVGMIAIMVSYLLVNRGSSRVKVLLFVSLGIALMAVMLTLSRTAAALAVGVILYVFFTILVENGLSRKTLLILGGLGAIITLYLLFGPKNFVGRIQDGINYAQAASYKGRLEQWVAAWEYIKSSPLFGWGPAKGSMITYTDNEYILVLRRYGIIGLFAYLGLFCNLFYQIFLRLRNRKRKFPYAVGLNAWLLASLAYGLTAGMFYNIQISSLFWILAGGSMGTLAADISRAGVVRDIVKTG